MASGDDQQVIDTEVAVTRPATRPVQVDEVEETRKRPESKPFYRPELDGLRLLAFLLVFLHHVFPREVSDYAEKLGPTSARVAVALANSGAFGLGLFFFLSAYLITTLMMKEMRSFGDIDIKAFYVRRILRIWPLYYLVLGIALLYYLHAHSGGAVAMCQYFALFVGNWYVLYHPEVMRNPLSPLWSISVEEQFYIALPLMMKVVGRRHIASAGAVMIVGSLAFLFFEGQMHEEIDTTIWLNAFSQALFFGAGIMCAAILDETRITLTPAQRVLCFLAGALLFVSAAGVFQAKRIGVSTSGASVAAGYLAVAIGCVFLLVAILDLPRRLPSFVVYGGKISYGLYVFHAVSMRGVERFLGRRAITYVLSLALTWVIAALSYRLYESQFLKLRQRFTRIKNRPV
jgi:peptidoglycan/LPS O-acetylase OafA/YrhL